MTDEAIIELYWRRAESAVAETEKVYGTYCFHIAWSILADREDSEEAVNDTWLAAWNAIPPDRPGCLRAYLGKITRRLAVTRLRHRLRLKRGGGEAALVLEELSECVPAPSDTEGEAETRELARALDRFLEGLEETERDLFLARYWYALRAETIGRHVGLTPAAVRTRLHRTRKKLREFLEKEGFV